MEENKKKGKNGKKADKTFVKYNSKKLIPMTGEGVMEIFFSHLLFTNSNIFFDMTV